MAKQSIANPVVSLGLDSSGLRSGIASSMSDVKGIGNKIGQSLKSSINTPFSLFGSVASMAGSAASMAVPLNAALNIASMAASAAKSMLTAPMNALMSRESFLAEQRGMPLLAGSDAGYTGVFSRLGAQWNDLLADMMSALDKAFNFRGWIEYVRGVMAGVSVVMVQFFGNLKEVTKDPEALSRQFKAGALFTVTAFETIGIISVKIANVFIDLANWLRRTAEYFAKKNEDIAGGGAFTPEQEDLIAREMVKMELTRAETIKGLRTVGLLPRPEKPAEDIAQIGVGGVVAMAKNARKMIEGMRFAPAQLDAEQAKTVAGVLTPIMEKMAQSRITSALTSDSTALVEAVTRASVAGPGQDLQQRVAAAAEENVRIAKATQTVQQKILDAYLNSDAYKNNLNFRI
jgi:hypothetical protein